MEGRGTMNADLNKFLLLLCRNNSKPQTYKITKNALTQQASSTSWCVAEWQATPIGKKGLYVSTSDHFERGTRFLFAFLQYIFTVEVIDLALYTLFLKFIICRFQIHETWRLMEM